MSRVTWNNVNHEYAIKVIICDTDKLLHSFFQLIKKKSLDHTIQLNDYEQLNSRPCLKILYDETSGGKFGN